MANPEHVQLLIDGGVEEWNKFRRNSQSPQPDLSGADLSGYDFTNLDLSHANLEGVDLSDAYLYRANLTEANLTRANFTEADILEANFIKAITIFLCDHDQSRPLRNRLNRLYPRRG